MAAEAASEEPVFWDMEASRVRLVVAVSHVWETREHPDPYRHQLTLLVRWMDLHPTPAGIPRALEGSQLRTTVTNPRPLKLPLIGIFWSLFIGTQNLLVGS